MLSKIAHNDKEYLHAIVRDVSRFNKLELELKESNKYLDLALSGAGLGIWDWYLKDNSVRFDERWAEMLGLDINKIQ